MELKQEDLTHKIEIQVIVSKCDLYDYLDESEQIGRDMSIFIVQIDEKVDKIFYVFEEKWHQN